MIKATATQNGEDSIVRIPKWMWALFIVVFGSLLTGAGVSIAAYGGLAWQHAQAITVNNERLANQGERILENKHDIERLEARFESVDLKLDRILQKLQ